MFQPTDQLATGCYHLTRSQLLYDLYVAFYDAARHKHKMAYVQKFEQNLRQNLEELCDDLLTRRYKALPSKCFIVSYPQKREVFCAAFRDRIIHHLYFRYTHQIFERTFIADTYSCIEGRGTHYGISRIRQHIREASLNWQEPAYAMSLDIRGYFMHINREKLLRIATDSLKKMSTHRVGMSDEIEGVPSGVLLTPATRWCDIRDFDFILWLTHEIVLLDPTDGCRRVGNISEWDDVDASKLMANAPADCGMPIGNLTSQLFSNVYMNSFDQMVKRLLHFLHYGRYVDDSATISSDRQRLTDAIPVMRDFLKEELCLDMHMGKTQIIDVRYGVEFLGAFIKPYRTYICNRSLSRIRQEAADVMHMGRGQAFRTVNSLLGVMSHYSSYNLRRDIFTQQHILRYGTFDRDMTVYELSKPAAA